MLCKSTDHPQDLVGKTNKILNSFTKIDIFWILATSFVFLRKNPERWPIPESGCLCLPAHKVRHLEMPLHCPASKEASWTLSLLYTSADKYQIHGFSRIFMKTADFDQL